VWKLTTHSVDVEYTQGPLRNSLLFSIPIFSGTECLSHRITYKGLWGVFPERTSGRRCARRQDPQRVKPADPATGLACPTIAELLKPLGYATAQFGKNRLGDRNEYLPTAHGFDECYGNLYHLNAEEEPELPDYPNPRDFPHFRERFGTRGVMDCKATDTDDATVDPRFGRVGKQTSATPARLPKAHGNN
jgi:Sulfatase